VAAVEAIMTRSVRDQLFDVILERVLSGRYRPGERLHVEALRGEFGVSITPIREALQRLAASGFVEVRAREGVFVSTLDAKRAAEIYDVRCALEVLAARNAATRIPEAKLAEIIRRYREADAELAAGADDEPLGELEPAIHDLMLAYSDNELLRDILTTVHRQGAWVRRIAGKEAGYLRHAFVEHKVILDALARHDADAAGEATRRHLEATKAEVLRFLEAAEQSERSPAREG
jgi:GntR family transcriptional regulator, rspAB operon transcriptional repressor